MTNNMLSLRIRPILVAFALLFLLLLTSCGTNTTTRQNNISSLTPTSNGSTPEPGTQEKPIVYPTGHFESLLVANGLTYIASDNGDVYAMQAASGQMRWHYNTGSQVFLFATMNGNIYVEGGANGDTIYALNALTGTLAWQHQVDSGIFGDVASNGFIYLNTNGEGNGGSVYALNGATGAQVWRYTGQVDIPQPLVVADGVVYFLPDGLDNNRSSLVALRASDGQQLWSFPLSASPAQTPIASNGVVYLADGLGTIDALSASSGKVLWHFTGFTGSAGGISLAVANGTMYAVGTDSTVYAIRLSDGHTLWQQNTRINFSGMPIDAPVVENGIVYIGRNDGDVSALRASDGAILWQEEQDRSVFPPFLVVDNTVYVNTQLNALYALRGADGSLLWQSHIDTYSTWSPMYHPVVVANGNIYAGTEDGIVRAFNASSGKLLWQYKIPEKAVLPQPVYSAEITFKSSVSYAQALRQVTDLGLEITAGCPPPQWQPLDYEATFSGNLLVFSTTAAAPLWFDRLKASSDIKQMQENPAFSCPAYMNPTVTPTLTYLPPGQENTYVGVSFTSSTGYGTALDEVTNLGFRLANPCYEQARAQNKQPSWTTMGQETPFAATYILLLATTRGNAVSWQQQIQTTSGVVKVEVSPATQC